MEFGIYWTYSAFVSDFIPTTCPYNWGSTISLFIESSGIHLYAECIVTPQDGEQEKTNVLKQDRGAPLSIVKGLREPSYWEKQNVGHAKKSGQNPWVLGWGLELERAEHGVTSEVLHAVLAFLPFSRGSKEQLEIS